MRLTANARAQLMSRLAGGATSSPGEQPRVLVASSRCRPSPRMMSGATIRYSCCARSLLRPEPILVTSNGRSTSR